MNRVIRKRTSCSRINVRRTMEVGTTYSCRFIQLGMIPLVKHPWA